MSKHNSTLVLYSGKETTLFLNEKPIVKRILPLTPNAHAPLVDKNLKLIDSYRYYTDYSHMKARARTRKMERSFIDELDRQPQLSSASKEYIRHYVHIFSNQLLRIYYSIKDVGPWVVRNENNWIYTNELNEAYLYTAKNCFYDTKFMNFKTGGMSYFINYINKKILIALIQKKTPLFVNDFGYGMNNLADIYTRKNPDSIIVGFKPMGSILVEIITILKNLLTNFTNNKKILIALAPKIHPNKEPLIKDLLFSISDKTIKDGMRIFFDKIIEHALYTDSSSSVLQEIMSLTKPKFILLYQFKVGMAPILAEEGKKFGSRVIALTHGSHTHQNDTCSLEGHKELGRGLIIGPFITDTVVQSPVAEQFVKNNYNSINRLKYKPIMWGYKKKNNLQKGDIRRILYSNTFHSKRPWIFETSDEFVKGVIGLIQSTALVPNTKLTIRFRPMPECSLESFKKLLPKAHHYEINTEGIFLEDLAKTDLLVSYSSTTIEEALNARCPVLLWGGSMRYHHLTPSMFHPTIEERHAVYAPRDINDLGSMISAILDVHKGRPLTNDEIKDYVWPEDTPGIDDFVDYIARLQIK